MTNKKRIIGMDQMWESNAIRKPCANILNNSSSHTSSYFWNNMVFRAINPREMKIFF